MRSSRGDRRRGQNGGQGCLGRLTRRLVHPESKSCYPGSKRRFTGLDGHVGPSPLVVGGGGQAGRQQAIEHPTGEMGGDSVFVRSTDRTDGEMKPGLPCDAAPPGDRRGYTVVSGALGGVGG